MDVLIVAIIPVVGSIPLYMIAKRMEVENAWLAFIPILNIFALTAAADKRGEMKIGEGCGLIIVTLIPFVGWLFFLPLWGRLAVQLGKSSRWGWPCVLPVLGTIWLWVLWYVTRERASLNPEA